MSRISLIHQAGALKSYFPESKIMRRGEAELKWIGTVTPSPLSSDYILKLHYKISKGAKVYVIDPKPLRLAKGEEFLPHVYSTPEQQLCLYYPDYNEWGTSKYYVKTLIPWACEWLIHYECWVVTGTWHGGGIHIDLEENKSKVKSKNDDE